MISGWKPVLLSHLPNPLPVLPHCLERYEIARVKNVPRRRPEAAPFQIVPRVAGADGHELEHTGVAVAVNHAAGAAVADELRVVPVVHVAHRRLPVMAAVEVEVRGEVEILVSAEATKLFLFTAQMSLHLGE